MSARLSVTQRLLQLCRLCGISDVILRSQTNSCVLETCLRLLPWHSSLFPTSSLHLFIFYSSSWIKPCPGLKKKKRIREEKRKQKPRDYASRVSGRTFTSWKAARGSVWLCFRSRVAGKERLRTSHERLHHSQDRAFRNSQKAAASRRSPWRCRWRARDWLTHRLVRKAPAD